MVSTPTEAELELGHIDPCSDCQRSIYRVRCLECKTLAYRGHDKTCFWYDEEHAEHPIERKEDEFYHLDE